MVVARQSPEWEDKEDGPYCGLLAMLLKFKVTLGLSESQNI